MLFTEERILVEFLQICLKRSIGKRKQLILSLLADYYEEMNKDEGREIKTRKS